MKIKPDTIIEFGLIFLIIFTPLAFGSVHIWAYTIMEVIVLLLLLTFLFSRPIPRSLRPASNAKSKKLDVNQHPSPFTLNSTLFTFHFSLFLLFLGLIIFQMVPLPATVIKHLSPNTYALYQQTLAGYDKKPDATEKEAGVRSQDFEALLNTSHPRSLLPASFFPPPDFLSLDLTPRSSSSEPISSHLDSRPLTIYGHATKTEFLKFFVYIAVFFLIITTMTNARQIRKMVLTIIFTGTGVAFLSLCQMLSKSGKIYGFWQSQYKIGSYGGPFINANHLAGYLELVILLALGFLVSREKPGIIPMAKDWKQRLSMLESWLAKNILLIFIIVLMASGLFISASRGGILSLTFSLGLFFLLLGLKKSQKGKRKIILLISGLIFICVLWLGIGPVITKFATLANPATASGERLQVWRDTVQLSSDFPFFGIGLGNFQNLYPKYSTLTSSTFWEHAHNDYLELLADTGWVGFILFFGGIFILLFSIMKKWKDRRDPFVIGITLGGCTGALAILCHSVVEFNLHIPANAFLLFVILGLSVVAFNLKKREEEFSPLPVRRTFLSSKIKKPLIIIKALIVVFMLTLVMKDYLAYRFFMNSQSLSHAPRLGNLIDRANPGPLKRAIFFDSGNARYRYELGNYYARKMSEAWKQGAWNLQEDHWVIDAEENIRFFGLKALQSYSDAIKMSPANAGYHFYRGWTLSELKRFSDFSLHPIPLSKSCDPETEFSRALMLDPNNNAIRKYINAVNSKK